MKRLLLMALVVFSSGSLSSAGDPSVANERLAAAFARLGRHDPQSPSFDRSLTDVDYLNDEFDFLRAAKDTWGDHTSREYVQLALRRARAGLVQSIYVTDKIRKLVADGKATEADWRKELLDVQAAVTPKPAATERSRLGNAEREAKAAERELRSAVNMYNAQKRNARFAAEKEAQRQADLAPSWYGAWPTYSYGFAGSCGLSYGGFGGYGGAYIQGYGGMMLPGAYFPYSYGGFSTTYGYGFGYGWGGGY